MRVAVGSIVLIGAVTAIGRSEWLESVGRIALSPRAGETRYREESDRRPSLDEEAESALRRSAVTEEIAIGLCDSRLTLPEAIDAAPRAAAIAAILVGRLRERCAISTQLTSEAASKTAATTHEDQVRPRTRTHHVLTAVFRTGP